MKKILLLILSVVMLLSTSLVFGACGDKNVIYVNTNAYFAPFEYYDGTKIVGVDVDIMNMVGEKLGKKVKFVNTDFGVIIDNVQKGKKYDCGAAGITVTPQRAEKVAFSNTYFTTVQYVIYKGDTFEKAGTTEGGVDYLLWEDLAGKMLGVQMDTTGHIFADAEINDEEVGVLYNTGATLKTFDDAQLAADGLGSKVDAVIVDKLPAEYITSKNSQYKCLALYYDAETATQEDYAICVTKGNTELLDAINAVLAELGEEGINALVAKHLGLEG